jgi:hypothetical protein
MKHIIPFEAVFESIQQHGIVLIKGKPRGKDGEKRLYATHVNTWVEVRPGATRLFISDSFYRIFREDGKLKGHKIDWRDETQLKDSLNFKTDGKLSVVVNNNKTPYHWKTLKQTSLRDALDQVERDVRDSEYLL